MDDLHIPRISMTRVAHLGPRWRAVCMCGYKSALFATTEQADGAADLHRKESIHGNV